MNIRRGSGHLAFHRKCALFHSRRVHEGLPEVLTSIFATLNVVVGRTLGIGVRPLRTHSSISGGAFTEVAFAASIKGSLIIETVNCLVARMFSRLSLGFPGVSENETLSSGGL